MTSHPVFSRQQGVTLIELIAVIVILGISLIGVTTAISSAVSRSSDVLLEARALALAQSYLDEILSRRFDENTPPRGIPPCRSNCTDEVNFGPDGGESDRQDFDDVDDYDGLDEGYEQANPLQDAEGNTRTGYENFRVRVSVRYLELGSGGAEENLASAPNDLTDAQDAKFIKVTVSHVERPDGWEFGVYKANF
ncbi:prepilin-type N-terminal cleavage/methylation domain-containing protein [Pseudohongiella sp. SYSU M77423]|uniref:type IV pilus modification PilV family protein n=1 Tax=Pseudohongiella sp. SYSU M77423 TaxID=3042312 RepID=UPI00247FB515|nr:prepilin-type N-terminal cleavage/methylation domain-containing protein [Pseudohongiella sp. SYSU M77423]MDH7942689.1 prepilin-type N-terminal cleavage/methylation domain-containing protein [Pseudohongiella sp. SYSU M77423]